MRNLTLVLVALFVSLAPLAAQSSDGTCTNPVKIGNDVPVTKAPGSKSDPRLVWNGSGYGAAWTGPLNSSTQVYFVPIDSSGAKVGKEIPVAATSGAAMSPSLVWGPGEYGLAWVDTRDGNPEIYFARLDRSGLEVGDEIRITRDPARSTSPMLVWTGREYGIAWEDDRDDPLGEIYFVRLDPSGARLGAETRLTFSPGDSTDPFVAWTGDGYGIAWRDSRDNNGAGEIYFMRLDSSGSKIAGDMRVTVTTEDSLYPRLVWSGLEFGLSWSESFDNIFFTRLSPLGAKLSDDIWVDQDTARSFLSSLVWTGSEYGIAWGDQRDAVVRYQLYLARLDPQGAAIGAQIRITNVPGSSNNPSIVWTGSGYSMAWNDSRDSTYQVYLARLTCACTDLDGDGYTTCDGDCDDTNAAVHPGATETCNGVDDDCNGSIDEPFDADGDGVASCDGDCNDADAGNWSAPTEARDLLFVDASNLGWSVPNRPGGIFDFYDVVRSADPADFVTSATCVISRELIVSASDADVPSVGSAFYYLVRPQNWCPNGAGPVGDASSGVAISARICP